MVEVSWFVCGLSVYRSPFTGTFTGQIRAPIVLKWLNLMGVTESGWSTLALTSLLLSLLIHHSGTVFKSFIVKRHTLSTSFLLSRLSRRMFFSFCRCGQIVVLDRLGHKTQNRVGVDGRPAQRGAAGWGGPGLAYWTGCGLHEWKQDLLVWCKRKHHWVHEAGWHREEDHHIRRSELWDVVQSQCRNTNTAETIAWCKFSFLPCRHRTSLQSGCVWRTRVLDD